jgi:hypothetical protein
VHLLRYIIFSPDSNVFKDFGFLYAGMADYKFLILEFLDFWICVNAAIIKTRGETQGSKTMVKKPCRDATIFHASAIPNDIQMKACLPDRPGLQRNNDAMKSNAGIKKERQQLAALTTNLREVTPANSMGGESGVRL